MRLPLSVNNQSVDSSGITNDYKEAICEYIWNGFEANATKVSIDYVQNEILGIEELTIKDDGDGISYDDLNETFGAFLTSKKRLLSLKAKSKINKGKGRFSFTTFAKNAIWETTYKDQEEYKHFIISMTADAKDVVECSEPEIVEEHKTGTSVRLTNVDSLNIENMNFEVIEPILLKEFAWFLYLYKDKNLEIIFNNEKLDYSKYVNTDLSETAYRTIEGFRFEISLVVWQEMIKEKFCCYFFDSESVLKTKDTTSFNRNTINFNHSVYVKSNFFDSHDNTAEEYGDPQVNLFVTESDKKIFGKLRKEIQAIIEKKISIYLSDKAEEIVNEMENERDTFPHFSDDMYDQMRKKNLKRVAKEIYKIEPLIFFKLKPIQEKSLLGLLNLLLSSEERENVLTIVEQVVDLTPKQRSEFSNMLKKTSLENIIDTIKYLEERFKVIEALRAIVYDFNKFTNERDHIQKLVEKHFWLFGEQYNLASADQRMRKELEEYLNILYGEADIKAGLNPDAENERRMDIFLCDNRMVETSFGTLEEENVIVELKAPKVVLTKKVYRQIEDYMDYVRRQPAFNGVSRRWKFIAVCTEVDENVKSRYKTFEDKGKVGLVNQVENYEVYALTWDDVIKSFELKYQPLLEKLKYDREQVANELMMESAQKEGREKVEALTEAVLL